MNHFKYACIILFSISLSAISLASHAAAQLSANVDRAQLGLQETLTLELRLTGLAQQRFNNSQMPDTSPLKQDFHILDIKQQYSLVSGGLEMHWQYTIQPKRIGKLQIPSLSVLLEQQRLSSQPISIAVQQHGQTMTEYQLETLVSTHTPYLQQPFLYTLRLQHNGKIKISDEITLPQEGVMIEQLGQWQSRQIQVNGAPQLVAERHYLLTPLRSGTLNFPPAQVLIGERIYRNRQQSFFGFGGGGANYRPKNINSAAGLDLNVRPAQDNLPFWLPLKALRLSETWETDLSQPLEVGVPLIRTVKLAAVNMGAQALPDFSGFFATHDAFRVNQPKPETERTVLSDNVTPVTSLTQSFSITPLQTGTLQIPAIKIPWWNVETHELAWAELPAQTVTVIPNQSLPSLVNTPQPDLQPAITSSRTITVAYAALTPMQYGSLAVALIALCAALVQMAWQTQVTPARGTAQPKPSHMSPAQFKRRLTELDDLSDIKALIQHYAHQRWQLAPQMGLQQIITYLNAHYAEVDKLAVVFNELERALYSPTPQPLNLDSWKTRCSQFLLNLTPQTTAAHATITPTLNPV